MSLVVGGVLKDSATNVHPKKEKKVKTLVASRNRTLPSEIIHSSLRVFSLVQGERLRVGLTLNERKCCISTAFKKILCWPMCDMTISITTLL